MFKITILGERLKQLRTSKGLNQTQLSEALNERFCLKTDRVMISKWETGFQTPMIHTISCIAKYFNVSIDYLNGEEEKSFPDINLPSPNITQSYISLAPDPSPQTQTLLVFNKNGVAGGHEKTVPSDDVLNEINKLAQALMPYPAEQINSLLTIIKNGGNIPIQTDLPSELKELIAVAVNLPPEKIKALITVAENMK